MVGFVGGDRDLPRSHRRGQALPFLLGKGDDGLFQLDLAGVAGAQGSGDHTVQTREPQEGRQQAEAARSLQAKDQVSSGTELVDEVQSGRGVEESREYRVGSEAALTAGPILEGRRR